MFKKNASRGMSVTRVLIVSLFIGLTAVITASASWTDYIDPFGLFTSANETAANASLDGKPAPTPSKGDDTKGVDMPVQDLLTNTSYPASVLSGVALEDMSSGTSTLVAASVDDSPSSAVTNIGFDFWLDGVRYSQFSANANGQVSLGATTSTSAANDFATANPKVSAYWDDQCTDATGKVHYKVVGSAPNRKLVVEFNNMRTYASGCLAGSLLGNYQVWLYESAHATLPGVVQFVYGTIPINPNLQSGYSVGIGSSSTSFASITTATPSVSYATSNNTQLTAITSGTSYRFTPVVPNADPTDLTFTSVTATGMTLNWLQTSSNESGFAIYRSDDGGATYNYITQAAANTVSSAQTGLTPGITYFWKVYAVTEGALSTNAAAGSQATTAAATYFYVGAATGSDFSTAASWNTAANGTGSNRTTALTTDILVIDGIGTTNTLGGITIAMAAAQSLGALQITNSTAVTLQSSTTTTRTVTLTGSAGDELSVPSGSSLILNNATQAGAIAFSTGSGMTGNIAGTLTLGGVAANALTTTGGTGTVVTFSSTGVVNNSLGTITGSAATLSFANGSNYNHQFTTANGTIPTATWGTTSNVNITSYTTNSILTGGISASTFGNLTWNCPAQTGNISLGGGTVTVAGTFTMTTTNTGSFRLGAGTSGQLVVGNFTQTGGSIDFASGAGSGIIRASGTFNQSGGTLTESSTGSGNIEFNGTSSQAVTLAGTISNTINYRINNNAGITLTGTIAVTTGASMTVSSGGTPITGGTVTYTGTTSLIYNSTSAAQTASGEFPSASGPTNLTINNTNASPNNTVTIALNRTLPATGVLTLTSGILVNTGNVLTIGNTATGGISGGSSTVYVRGAIARTLPASLVSGSTYTFPIGKGTYNPFQLVNPTTTASASLAVVQAEAFDANAGGTAGTNMQSINTDRYWAASITANSGSFTSSFIRLTDSSSASTSAIAASSTLTGAYDLVGGTNPTVVVGTSVTTVAPAATTIPGFYAIGTKSVAMVYTSSTTTQAVTSNVFANTSDNQIIGIQIVTTGNASPLSATSFTLNTNGTTAPATDITNAKLWYTGTSSTFATTSQFGSTNPTPSGSYSITGSQTLSEGTNYFWLTYDIPSGATGNNFVDAEATSLNVGGAQTPTPTAPAGSRTIKAPLSGAISVCNGGTYPTLKSFFDEVNSTAVSGNIVLTIAGDCAETATASLNQWTEAPINSNFTMTIVPLGTRTISGSLAALPIIKLNGADRVTIDGLNASGNSLSITNSNATGTVIWLASLGTGAGATNNTIQNTTITGGASTAGSGICVGGATLCAVGADNDNTTIQGNTILKVFNGISASGTAAVSAGGDDTLVVNNNVVGPASSGANNIGGNGIIIGNAVSPGMSGNTVQNVVGTGTVAGIALNTGAVSGTVTQSTVNNVTTSSTSLPAYGVFVSSTATSSQVTRNTVSNITATATAGDSGTNAYGVFVNSTGAQVLRNSITGISNASTLGYPARGIYVNTGVSSSSVLLENNMVSDVFSYSDPSIAFSFQPVGIMIDGATGGVNVYSNSVNLFGSHPGLTSATLQAAMFVGSTVTALDIRDNILVNTYNNSSSTTDKSYAIYSAALNTAYTSIDYNDYYVSGAAGTLAFIGSDRTNLAGIVTGFGGNTNSKNADPNFTSTTNLHIKNGAADPVSPVARAGVTISGITTDYDGDTRKTTPNFPDIGADEFNTYLVTYDGNTNTGGTAPVDASSPYNPGATVTVQGAGSLVKTNYTFAGWNTLADGSGIPYAPAATFTAAANTTLYAQWTLNQYTITATAGANGAISPSGAVFVNHGANQTFNITPDAGYYVDTLTVDGGSVPAANSYTFTNVTATHTISATFAINQYTITASAGANGAISPSGATLVNHGANQTYTITPDSGYHVDTLTVDGGSETPATSFTFTNVTATHTIAVTFVIDPMITVVGGPLNFGNQTIFTTSAEQTYTVQGIDLTGDITVTSPSTDFEVSLTTGLGFGPSVTLSPTSGTVAMTTIYVHFKPGSLGAKSGDITNATPGAATLNVAVSGTGTAVPAVPTKLVITNISPSTPTAGVGFSVTVESWDALDAPTNVLANTGFTLSTNGNAGAIGGTTTGTITAGTNSVVVSGVILPSAGSSVNITATRTSGDILTAGTSAGFSVVSVPTKFAITNISPATPTAGTGFSVTVQAQDADSLASNVQAATGFTLSTNGNAGAISGTTTGSISGGSATVTVPGVILANGGTGVTITATRTSGDNLTAGTSATFTVNEAAPTNLTYSTNPATYTKDVAITPNTPSNNGGTVASYSISPSLPTGLSFSTSTGVISGTPTVAAAAANYTVTATNTGGSTMVDVNITVNKATPVITFDAAPMPTYPGPNFTVNATTTNTDSPALTYSKVSGPCDFAGGATFTPTGAGSCVVQADGAATANFNAASNTQTVTITLAQYTITATAGAGGSITPLGVTTVNYDASQAYTITPSAGYHVLDVLVDGVSVGAVLNYTFSNVNANHTIDATFAINTYTVTYSNNGGTDAQTDPNSPYNHGLTVTVLGTGTIARTGYTFANWNTAANGSGTTYNPSDTFTITADTILYAQWTINQYSVLYDGNGNTGGTAPATQTADFGSSITLSGEGSLVRTGYTFAGWNTAAGGGGTPYAAGASFTIPAQNTTLYAQWTVNQYTVTYDANGGTGSQTDPDSPYNFGSTVTVLGTGSIARTGYTFANWNTAAGGGGTSYNPAATFTIGAANVVLYAQWTINTYTITATAGANGAISPAGVVTVNHGDDQAFTITANIGYHIADVLVDGVSAGAVGIYTFTNVTANHTIHATFAINTYTITGTAGANGSISPNGAVSVNHGANQTFTITPGAGYHVDVLTVDGSSVPAATSYTFTNVTATHTIDVTFAVNTTPIITFDAAPTPTYLGGDFTVNATTTNTDSAALTYSVVSGPCALVSGATFSSTGAGTCQVQASGAATTNYNAATATQNVTIAKANQATVTLSGVPSTATYGDTFTAVGGGGSGTGAFSYAVTGTACTVHPSTGAGSVVAVSGGCSVTATRAGDTNYNPATSAASVITTINPANQATLTVDDPGTVTYGSTPQLTTSGGSGTGAVTFSDGGSPGCSVTSGGVLTVTDASAACNVTATKAADANYNPTTSAARTITLAKANQATLTVDDPGTVTYGSTPQLTTSGGSGTGAVTFSDGGSAGCSVTSGGVLTVTDASAACNVTATKATDTNYNPTTSAQRTITLAKANQAALTAVATPSSVTYGSTSALSSTGGSGTGAVTFSSGASTGCSVLATTLSVTDASGTCEVTATKAADNNYNAATSAALTVTLVKATPTVTFGAAPTPTYLGGNFTVSASTTNTDSSALTYSVVSGPCALVSGATFSSSGAGTCQVQASGAATSNFTTASATQSVTIAKATPTVTFGAAPTPGYPGADFTVSASTTNTDSSALIYSKVSGPCIFVSGATFSSTGAGTCVVRADGAASTNFNAAFDTQNVTIAAVQYTITAMAGANGSITPSGSVVVNSGANQAFTITANAGYHIEDVLVDSVSQGATGSYTFTNVTANHTISATFAINTYTITASAGANGSITPNGPVVVNSGANQSFTITPDGGYNVANVLVDGISVGAVTSHTFTNVTANHTIAATFFSGTQALIVYVDDDWAGTTLGADPDGAGPASSFGYDAFATIQNGVAGVALNGTVIVNPGSYSGDVNVNRAINVKGVFTISGALTVTAAGASVSPGFSPGIINSGNLSLISGSNVNIEVNGPILGTQYDQLNVTGTVALGNANLNVIVGNAYTPSAGQTFTIVNNDGNDPVTGTFAGLAENDVFYAGTTSFRISYAGGSNNNDVVLTAVALCNSVSIPNYTTLNNNAVVASINVDNTTGNALQSTDFTITYNPAVVTYTSATLGSVTAGSVLNINSSTPGTLVVSIFNANPFSGAGSMLDITFNAVGQPGTSTPLAFNAFKFNEGTQCISTASGSVSVISGTITGTVTYGNSIPAATRHVPGTAIDAVGSVNASVLTNLAGAYSIGSLGAGSYTVTPSKSGGVNGAVTGFDAAQIAMWVVGTTTLDATQQTVADVSGTGGISSFDAALIARYAAALPNAGSSGAWRFNPTSTTHLNVNVNRTGDYTALLMGDVSGNWIDPLATRPAPFAELKPVVIGIPELSALVNTEVVVPVEISDTTNKGILAYQFELRYDPTVLEPAANPADLADTISSGYQVTVNAAERGLLRVVVFGTQPLSGGGRLINLRFNTIGNPGSASDLIWENLGLNEGGFDIRSTNGRIQVTASPSNNASLGGRVMSAQGQPIKNARLTLTDTTGQIRIAITNGLGYYQFTGLRLGETYTVHTSAKRHRFQDITVSVSGEAVNLDIIAQPGG